MHEGVLLAFCGGVGIFSLSRLMNIISQTRHIQGKVGQLEWPAIPEESRSQEASTISINAVPEAPKRFRAGEVDKHRHFVAGWQRALTLDDWLQSASTHESPMLSVGEHLIILICVTVVRRDGLWLHRGPTWRPCSNHDMDIEPQ